MDMMHKCKNCDEIIIKDLEICYECNMKAEPSEEINEDDIQSTNKTYISKTTFLPYLHAIISIMSVVVYILIPLSKIIGYYKYSKPLLIFLIIAFSYVIYLLRKATIGNTILLIIAILFYHFFLDKLIYKLSKLGALTLNELF